MTLYATMEYVRDRQHEMLDQAARQRSGQRARRLVKATRRAERAERQLSRSWSVAARLHAEVTRLAGDR
jgi:hypothetical protein